MVKPAPRAMLAGEERHADTPFRAVHPPMTSVPTRLRLHADQPAVLQVHGPCRLRLHIRRSAVHRLLPSPEGPRHLRLLDHRHAAQPAAGGRGWVRGGGAIPCLRARCPWLLHHASAHFRASRHPAETCLFCSCMPCPACWLVMKPGPPASLPCSGSHLTGGRPSGARCRQLWRKHEAGAPACCNAQCRLRNKSCRCRRV